MPGADREPAENTSAVTVVLPCQEMRLERQTLAVVLTSAPTSTEP